MLKSLPGAVRVRTVVALATLMAVASTAASAQSVTAFTACSAGALSNCTVVRLTSQLGVGPSGMNLFEIALRNLGSRTEPTLATSVYNLVLSSGQPIAPAGTEVDVTVTPAAEGGASIVDDSPWSVFEDGESIFLSSLSNGGVGGCAGGGPVDVFAQIGGTCGADQFITFSFFTSRAFDPTAMTVANLETVGLVDGTPGESCGAALDACAITAAPVTATPEPGTMVLAITGLFSMVGFRVGMRRRALRGGAQ